MRTTLVSGSQSLNEVETSPRHHAQRRASTVYLWPQRPVKLLFGHHRVQQLPQGSPPLDALWLPDAAVLVAGLGELPAEV